MANSTIISRKDMREPDRFQLVATQAATWINSNVTDTVLLSPIPVTTSPALIIAIAISAIVSLTLIPVLGAYLGRSVDGVEKLSDDIEDLVSWGSEWDDEYAAVIFRGGSTGVTHARRRRPLG